MYYLICNVSAILFWPLKRSLQYTMPYIVGTFYFGGFLFLIFFFSFLHFPLICGIIGVAVGFEIILGHPQDVLNIPISIALGGGYIFFVGISAAAVWRVSGSLLLPRIVILILSMIGLYFSLGQPPYVALIIIAASLLVIYFLEWRIGHLD